jgi:hypothetical protein
MFQRIAARVRAWFKATEHDRDLDQELESHIALAVEQHIRSGMSKEDAHRKARIELGGVTQLREAHRETRGLPFLDTLSQDLRYTFRTLRRDAGFTSFVILIAGLGIGASATIFSVVNAVLLRPLPFADSERLAWMGNRSADGVTEWTIQSSHLADLRAQNSSFTDLAGYYAFAGASNTKLTGEGEPVRLSAIPVTYTFFPLLGVQPVAGRLFLEKECQSLQPDVVLLSYHLWKSRYNLDPTIVGRPLTLYFAPIPSASESTAIDVNPGLRCIRRRA